MKHTLAIITLIMSLVSSQASEVQAPEVNKEHMDFSLRLLKTAITQNPKGNVILSPYSAGVAFSMLAEGARNITKDGLVKALSGGSYYGELPRTDSLNIVKTANSIWLNAGFVAKNDYISALENGYGAQLFAVDRGDAFDASSVNMWCAYHTEGLIPEIVSDIGPEVRMMLLNALYFKAPWLFDFDPNASFEGTFQGEDGQSSAMYMSNQNKYPYAELPGYKVASLPYQNGKYAMLIVLPDDMDAATEELSAENFEDALLSLRTGRDVRMVLPKFKLEYTRLLNDIMCSLGAAAAFGSGADFTGITDEPVFVTKAFQKCVLEVNEEGSEAAAVTAILMGRTAVYEPVVDFVVNKPFFFAIYDIQSRAILFEGKIATLK